MSLDADPYRTLGLSRGASLDEVKRAYRRLAKVNHPDAAGPGAIPHFLAIQRAYEQLTGTVPGGAGGSSTRAPGGRPTPTGRPAPSGRPGPTARRRATGQGPDGARSGRQAGPGAGRDRHGHHDPPRDSDPAAEGGSRTRAARGKATLGSTSYDGADAGPFEPDWAGASWYGTTSGTYWTINPKEYADPRKHGPEYQARARRAASPGAGEPPGDRATAPAPPDDPGPEPRHDRRHGAASAASHTTRSWWDTTAGPTADDPRPPYYDASSPDPRSRRDDAPVPDPARAALDLARALSDPSAGGLRGHVVRALLGWFPIALGLGWLLGELTGCGRFAAICDPSVGPLTVAGQGILLAALLLLPEIAAIAAGAALVFLAAAILASLVLSATGAAADEASRRAALGGLLLVAWLGGLAIALVRRVRSGPRAAGPVS